MRPRVATSLVLAVTACGGGFAEIRAEHQAAVRTRASFDMSCPESKLTLTPLQPNEKKGEVTRQYGVEGCGQKTVYVNVAEDRWSTGTWVLEADGGGAPAAGSPAAPAAK